MAAPFHRVLSMWRSYKGQQLRSMAALTMDNLNPRIKSQDHPVPGNQLIARAKDLEQEMTKGVKKPFQKVFKGYIGDPHAMGQRHITFIRQVLALVSNPQLCDQVNYPEDVQRRAKDILGACYGGSIGAYTLEFGIELIRKQVATFIEKRDGFPANWEDINICAGASSGIKNVLQLFCDQPSGRPSGVMIPIPQHPLYSSLLQEYGIAEIPYFLNEENYWGVEIAELENDLHEARNYCDVRALVVVNPGNPTGQVLSRANIEELIKFSYKENLLILADETYQHNVYDPISKFHSFKKVLRDLGGDISLKQELVSCMSVSKGYAGECGIRGGWLELINLDTEVRAELFKATAAKLCPTTLGQVVVSCVANPPEPGSPSFELYEKERVAALDSLAERAEMVSNSFNTIPGFKCNPVQGALYAFPSFELPPKALEAAKKLKQPGDVFYASQLLEATGICVVPGSAFRQKPGTLHFCITILAPKPLMQEILDTLKDFHLHFMSKYK